jgi:hypothetical protein
LGRTRWAMGKGLWEESKKVCKEIEKWYVELLDV